jgi:hypothetical protein
MKKQIYRLRRCMQVYWCVYRHFYKKKSTRFVAVEWWNRVKFYLWKWA